MGCQSSGSNDLSVHGRIDSSGYVRLLLMNLMMTEDGHAAIFEVKFGKKTEGITTESRERSVEQFFDTLEPVAFAVEGSDLGATEDPFEPTARCINDTKEEATGDQVRCSKTKALRMPPPSRTGNEGTCCSSTCFSKRCFNKCVTLRLMSLRQMPTLQHTSAAHVKSTKMCTIPQLPSC